jgi:alpha-L-rhamnosidase
MSDFQDIQRKSGQLPAIVPTGGWGYNWSRGPVWGSAIMLIPWYI